MSDAVKIDDQYSKMSQSDDELSMLPVTLSAQPDEMPRQKWHHGVQKLAIVLGNQEPPLILNQIGNT